MEDNKMLFNYLEFLEELRKHRNPEKRKVIKRWEKISSATRIEEEPFYAYLKKFNMNNISYKVPKKLSTDFDWELLFQLVAGSFSCEYQLTSPNLDKTDTNVVISEKDLPELYISVKSGNASVTKRVSELWSFQILRLYEIFLEEQINLNALMLEDENESNPIEMEREMRINKFKYCKQEYLLYKNNVVHRNLRNKILDSLGSETGKNAEN